jgi:hypothetical protein
MANYVTFEQAKWLKEKEFHLPTLSFYVIDDEDEDNGYGELGELVDDPNYSFPSLADNTLFDALASAPEQHQVVEWLRVNHSIWISVGVDDLFHKGKFYILIKKHNIDRWDLISLDNKIHSPYDSPQEAYSAAFDYIKDNNLI